jgi:hypothetical protein
MEPNFGRTALYGTLLTFQFPPHIGPITYGGLRRSSRGKAGQFLCRPSAFNLPSLASKCGHVQAQWIPKFGGHAASVRMEQCGA